MTTGMTVQFVHFPKSSIIQSWVQDRIEECVAKLHVPVRIVKAFFTREGLVHHVKLVVDAGVIKACVDARADDVAHAIERALHKLIAAFEHTRGRRQRVRHVGYSAAKRTMEIQDALE